MSKYKRPQSSIDGESIKESETGVQDASVTPYKSESNSLQLLHELQVHQIELELQNEQLIEARDAAEQAAVDFSELYDFAPVGYVTLNFTGHITRSNLVAAQLIGTKRKLLLGKRLASFVAQAALPSFNHLFSPANIQSSHPVSEVLLAGKQAKTVQMDISINENDLEYRLVLTDITERQQAQVKLQLAASVFSHAHEGIMITDVSGTILDVNDMFSQITGFEHLEVVGKNSKMLQSDHQTSAFYACIQQTLIDKNYWFGEVWNKRKNGEIYPEMQAISAVCDNAGKIQHYVSLFTDITDLKQHQQQLEHAAHFDALTNLPNRALLFDRLPFALLQCQRHSKMLAVVYIDLDGFKQINDTYGHDMGDQLLISISQHMTDALRECDTLARIGGDEFVAMLADLETPEDCKPILDRLQKAAAQTISLGDVSLNVSASMGIAIYPQSATNADLLLRQADQAMYTAKESGKDRYHFFDINSGVEARILHQNLNEVRNAFAQGDFILYYQPKINMRTLKVVGVEALIRWRHPVKGLLEPSEFLPFIENHPIHLELGTWVINTALDQISEWHKQGIDLAVSVNVGAYQLQHKNFFEQLTAALATHKSFKPSQLELEILETSALENMPHVSSLISDCKRIGVSFSLDDFGTGYSSLTYLKRLPSASLKIDTSFVQDMLTNPDDLAIVQGVIGLAEVFGRSVIAEGVESAAHGAKLLSMNCEVGQGYGIARPMPAADLPLWVQGWHKNPIWKA
jgi:diguanylate cyclase (GGDEF)-like protein/PAS domain S-box-containing protein